MKGYSCDEVYLGEAFLVMFFILTTKEDWVAEVWEQEGEKKCWNSHFSRQFHDWELEEVEVVFRKFQSQSIDKDIRDKMV